MIVFLRRIWGFVRPYQSRLILGLICGILYGLTNGAFVGVLRLLIDLIFPTAGAGSFTEELRKAPKFLQPLIESITPLLPQGGGASKVAVALAIGAIPFVMLLRGLLSYLNVYLMSWAAIRAVADMRTKLFGHLQNLSLQFFSKSKTGDLISRITNDTIVLYNIIGASFASIIKDPITLVVLLSILLSQQPKLTLISMLVFPVCLVPMIIYGRKVRRSIQAIQNHSSELTSLMHEAFTGNRMIKAYNLEDTVLREFKSTSDKFVSQAMRILRSFEVPSQLTEFLGSVGVAMVFLYVLFVPDKSKTAGDFFSFIASVFLMYQPVKSLSKLHNQLQQARAASERIFELLL